MPARVIQHLRIGGMIGAFDGNDGFPQRRVFLAQVAGEFLFALGGTDHENLVRTRERLCDVVEEMMIRRRSMTAMLTFAAVNALMLVLGADLGLILRGR